jgi:acetate kinase
MATTDAILVLNAGSSSLKFALFALSGTELSLVEGGQESAPPGAARGHEEALARVFEGLKARRGASHRVVAVGHRVVHGGSEHVAPTRVDAALLDKLEDLIPLAPLHLPHNLAPMRALLQRAPELPQVACFDTAMHATMPALERMFALPPELEAEGVRRYGFHGLSYEYVAAELPHFDQRAASGKTVVLHLGNGASMCALDAGRSVACTMGFSTLEGLPMGTRSGTVDPGVLLYLVNQRGMEGRALEKMLYERSGLLGVSGLSSDVRVLAASKAPRAALALDLFAYRISRELGSLAAALGGLDAVVFTAGIGQHQAPVREAVCRRAAWLGVELDARANAGHGPRITTAESRTAAWVIPTNEELVIARHTRALLRPSS